MRAGLAQKTEVRWWTAWAGWLKAKLRLRADCGLWWRLLWWEKLTVSHENLLERVLEASRQTALFPLWPLSHRQHCSTAKTVVLLR